MPATLAGEIADLVLMTLVPEIMQIASDTGISLDRTAQGYFAVTDALRIDRLLSAAEHIPRPNSSRPWRCRAPCRDFIGGAT